MTSVKFSQTEIEAAKKCSCGNPRNFLKSSNGRVGADGKLIETLIAVCPIDHIGHRVTITESAK